MCGRFVLAQDVQFYDEHFAIDVIKTEALAPSYNVAPTDPVYAIAEHEQERQLGAFRWGLIPHYSKDRRTIHINARAESVADKPAFRTSFARRRCLIPADGFYEWEKLDDGSKQPHFISLEERPMAFAGIWTVWREPGTDMKLTTCAIITTRAAPEIENIHDRMPVSLQPDLWDDWLGREVDDPAEALAILEANQIGGFLDRPVSTLVNSVRNNDPRLLEAD